MIKHVYTTFRREWANKFGINMTPINALVVDVQELIAHEKHRHGKALATKASNFVGGSNTSKALVTVDLIAGIPPEQCPNYSGIDGYKQSIAAVLSASGYRSIRPAISFISTLQELSLDICNVRHVNALAMYFNFGYTSDKDECGCLARLLCSQANTPLEKTHTNYISQNDQVGRKKTTFF